MRLLGRRNPSLLYVLFSTFLLAATACSIYDETTDRRREGAAGNGSASGGGIAGSGGTGAGGMAGGGGTAGTSEDADGAITDASNGDPDAQFADASFPNTDARSDGANDAPEVGSLADGSDAGTPTDVAPGDALDSASDPTDGGLPPSDVAIDGVEDAPQPPNDVTDSPSSDGDAGARDVVDSGPTIQILPMHGTPIENADAGGPFASRCASDEVITGFIGRAGVQTDAIASTCSKLIGGALSSPRNLPLNGNLTGGNAFTVTCPNNYVAVSIVGRYGHNTMWKEDVTTAIGVVCKSLSSSATQTVTITGQPALDPGYTTFREDCTGGRYLTAITGLTDSNSLGFTVGQVGGECDVR